MNTSRSSSSKFGSISSSTILPDLPDLSHLSENERKIIEAVLERQKLEEENNLNIISSNNQRQKSFDSGGGGVGGSSSSGIITSTTTTTTTTTTNSSTTNAKNNGVNKKQHMITTTQSITDIAQEAKQKYGINTIDTGDVCDICKKTKFISSLNAHQCVYCKLKCCIRCAYKLRTKTKQLWACSQCKLKQDAILKSNQWLNSNNTNNKNSNNSNTNNIGNKSYVSDYLLNKQVNFHNKRYSSLLDNSTIDDTSADNDININDTIMKNTQQRSFDTNDDYIATSTGNNARQLKRNLTISGDNYMDYNNDEAMQLNVNNAQDISLPPATTTTTTTIKNYETVPPITTDNKIKHLSSSSSSSSVFLRQQQQMKQNQSLDQQQHYLSKQNSLDIENENEIYLNNQTQNKSSKKERLQDPLSMLKKSLMRNAPVVNDIQQTAVTATTTQRRILPKPVVNSDNDSTKNIPVLQKQYSSSSSSSLTHTSADSSSKQQSSKLIDDQIETISELDAQEQRGAVFKNKYNYYQRASQLLHTDSLSSDPSDCVSQRNSICLPTSTVLIAPTVAAATTKTSIIEAITTTSATAAMLNSQRPVTTSTTTSANKMSPSNNQQPSIIARMKRAKIKANKQHSLSSSDEYDEYEDVDEEIRSTTEYTTNDEMDLESGSISERGAFLRKIDRLMDKNYEKEEILAEKMKKFLSPITWKISADRQRLIGNIVFKKNLDDPTAPNSIGIKVNGGQPTPNGDVIAVIEKIKKGSPCDTIYHLKPGDEIVEWNQTKLRGLTNEQVLSIMTKTKFDPQIEIVVERQLNNNNNNNHVQRNDSTVISNNSNQFGQCEIKCYHDKVDNKLYIKLINLAINLLFKFDCIDNANNNNLHSLTQTSAIDNDNGINSNNNKNNNKKLKSLTQIENVYFEFYLYPKIDDEEEIISVKLSDIIKLETKNLPNYNLNQQKLIIFENITLDENCFIKISLLEYSTQTVLGQYKIELSKLNLTNESQFIALNNRNQNQHINTNNFTTTTTTLQTKKQLPMMTLLSQNPNESSNENLSIMNFNNQQSNNSNKRRQLPQIPAEKQQNHRDKVAHELEEKARTIKHDFVSKMQTTNRKKSYSISDSESNKDKYTLNKISSINSARLTSQTSYEDEDYERFFNNNNENEEDENEVREQKPQRLMPVIPASTTGVKPQMRIMPTTAPTSRKSSDAENIFEPSRPPHHQRARTVSVDQTISDIKDYDDKVDNYYRSSEKQLSQTEEHLLTPQHESAKLIVPTSTFKPITPARKQSPTHSTALQPIRSQANVPERFSIMKDLKQRSLAMSNMTINHIDGYNGMSNRPQLQKQYTTGHINNLRDDNKKIMNTYDFDSDGSEFSTMSTQSEKPKSRARVKSSTGTYTNQTHSKTTTTTATTSTTTTTATTTIANATTATTTTAPSNKLLAMLENDKKDGTLSDSALTNPMQQATDNKKRRASMAKALVILGLSKKSNSATNLTCNKRLGFARSEEIGAVPELRNNNIKTNEEAQTPDSASEKAKKPNLWSGAMKLPHERPFNDFVDSLGPGQKVGRQVLGSPCLGEIQIQLVVEKGQLVVEIIRARNLKLKSGYRVLPAAYVKLYLFDGRSCVEKQKTTVARRTLDPMYQEVLRFQQNPKDKVLQITVWGDYGKLDRKVFMGISQIVLNELDLSTMVIGWYKLYSVSSLMTDYHTLTSLSHNSSLVNLSSTESGYSIDSGSVKTTKN